MIDYMVIILLGIAFIFFVYLIYLLVQLKIYDIKNNKNKKLDSYISNLEENRSKSLELKDKAELIYIEILEERENIRKDLIDLNKQIATNKSIIESLIIEQNKIRDMNIPNKNELEMDKTEIENHNSIKADLFKAENQIRDAERDKLILHQKYKTAKEILLLYDKVLIDNANTNRNSKNLLFAIYDYHVKHTIPALKLMKDIKNDDKISKIPNIPKI